MTHAPAYAGVVAVPVLQFHQRPKPEYVPTVPWTCQLPPVKSWVSGYALVESQGPGEVTFAG